MASTASLQTKGRYTPVWHYILRMIRRYVWVMLLAGLVFATFTCIGTSSNHMSGDEFFFLMNYDSITPLRWSVVLFGLLSAFLLFGYLWNRRETNLYGSLGISRTKQFWIRYLCGLLFNLLPLALTLVASYVIGIQRIDADPHGVCRHYTGVFILAICLVSWLSYTLSVMVAVLCGRFLSAGICAAGVLALPYAVMLAAQSLMNTYLHGAPGGSMIYENQIPWLNFWENVGRRPGLFTMLDESLGEIRLYEKHLTEQKWVDEYMAERPLPAVKFLLLAGLALGMTLLAWWLFSRRKAEHAGQLYINPVLSHATSLTVGVLAGALHMRIVLPVERTAALWLKGLMFLGAVVVVSLLFGLILSREWRGLVRGLPVASGAAAVALVVMICLATGGFGYAAYIPETDEIASVQVTYNQNKTPYIDCRAGSGGSVWRHQDKEIDGVDLGDYRDHYYLSFFFPWTESPTLTSPEDIEVVRGIHKTIIEDGLRPRTGCEAEVYGDSAVTANYCISYTLKSGKVVNRYYENLSLSALEATLEIDNTSFIQEKIQTLHANGFIDPEQKAIISDQMFVNPTILDLTDEEKAALFAAIDADYADLSVEQRYFPAADEVLGVIYLSTVFESEIGGSSGSVEVEKVPVVPDLHSDLYFITTAYTRTLTFLEAHDLMQYMTVPYTVEAILVQDYTPRYQGDTAMTYQFRSVPNLNQLDGKHVDTITCVPVSDWEETIAASVPTAMFTRPGRLILIVMNSGDAVVRFVPDP